MSKNIKFKFQNIDYDVQVDRNGDTLTLVKDGVSYHVDLITDHIQKNKGQSIPVKKKNTVITKKTEIRPVTVPAASVDCSEKAPITGTLLEIKVVIDQQVKAGDLIAVLEAMKMEIEIVASVSGSVTSIMVNPGDNVKEKQPLLNIS